MIYAAFKGIRNVIDDDDLLGEHRPGLIDLRDPSRIDATVNFGATQKGLFQRNWDYLVQYRIVSDPPR